MHIYSFTYLFKHAVISEYMAFNDTMNDEQLIGSNAPAKVSAIPHTTATFDWMA